MREFLMTLRQDLFNRLDHQQEAGLVVNVLGIERQVPGGGRVVKA